MRGLFVGRNYPVLWLLCHTYPRSEAKDVLTSQKITEHRIETHFSKLGASGTFDSLSGKMVPLGIFASCRSATRTRTHASTHNGQISVSRSLKGSLIHLSPCLLTTCGPACSHLIRPSKKEMVHTQFKLTTMR